MQIKRNKRDFILSFGIRGGVVTVRPPFRISFNVDKSIYGKLNKMRLQVYGLSEQNRLALVKDAEEKNKRIPVELSIGYDDRFETIFKGTIQTCANVRQGPEIVTEIEGLDGGIDGLHSFTNRTVEGGARAIDACLQDMTNTDVGRITDRPVLSRPKVLVGNSLRLIEDTIGPDETWYIDNEQLYVVKDTEVVSRFIPVVNAATGLISTPSKESNEVTFETILNPTIRIGRRVSLQSTTAPHLNGIYKIETISYAGDNFGDAWDQVCTGKLAKGVTVL